MIDIREYQHQNGRCPFAEWFESLGPVAAAKVTVFVARLGHGNVSNVKSVGRGIHELRIDFGPGYRVYFGRDGEKIVILVGGGTKKRQHRDIATAFDRWQDYKQRKRTSI